ncbi:MAG TPA: hypothetical protein PLR78_18430, partial [Polaromonas sp.]|nr:hypothetical protein [Polaromonas sp.]
NVGHDPGITGHVGPEYSLDKSVCPNRAGPYSPKGGGRHDAEGEFGTSAFRARIDVPGWGARTTQRSGARSGRYTRHSCP